MKPSSLLSHVLLAASLTGCGIFEPTQPQPEPDPGYAELPAQKTTVSGLVFDPEAFYFSVATFPDFGPDVPPPPALIFTGIPHLTRSVAVGAQVQVVDSAVTSDTSTPVTGAGSWQVLGVPRDAEREYHLRAAPSADGVVVGAPDEFPPFFEPVPLGRYFPTTSLNTVRTQNTSCVSQLSTIAGDQGALAALSLRLGRSVDDLLDPTRSGGVVLVWTYQPSFFFDFEIQPVGGIQPQVEPGAGTVYALEWAPTGTHAQQSPMGFFVSAGAVSPLGYYAIVRPVGAPRTLALEFNDTLTGLEELGYGPRPWPLAPAVVEVPSGVSVLRAYAFPTFEPPPPPEYEEYVPEFDLSFLCRF